MTTFDKREEGFEKKFAHDEELRFKANARRNKLLGQWAAEKLGLSGDEAAAYAKEVVMSDFEEAGDHDVFKKVRKDFDAKGVAQSDHQIRRTMDELMEKAIAEIRSAADSRAASSRFAGTYRFQAPANRQRAGTAMLSRTADSQCRTRPRAAARCPARDSPAAPSHASLSARGGGRFALVLRHEIDHDAQRKRDEVGDVRPDRHLPLEALAGEPAVIDQRVPQRALGVGRVAPEQAREPAHRRRARAAPGPAPCSASSARSTSASSPSSTPPRAGPLRPSAIAMITPCSVWMSCRVGCMRWKMLRRLISMVVALLGRPEEFDLLELALERGEEREQLLLGRRLRLLRHGERQCAAGRELEPLVGDDEHRLREVERGEGRIDRQGDDAVGERRPRRSPGPSARGRTGCRPSRRRRCAAPSGARPLRRSPPASPGRGRAPSSRTRACSRRSPPPRCRTVRRRRARGRRRRPRPWRGRSASRRAA